jgi:hypothetical protein
VKKAKMGKILKESIMKKRNLTFILFSTAIFFTTAILTGCPFFAGTYTRNGSTATIYMDGEKNGTATVSGNTLSGSLDGQRFTATKVNTASNPFAGTWRGTDDDGDSMEIVFGNTILMAYYREDIDDIDESNVGIYEFDGNEAEWEIDDQYDEAVITGNRMKGTLYEVPFTATRANTGSNPFAGTWRGSVEGIRFECVIGETTWAFCFFD